MTIYAVLVSIGVLVLLIAGAGIVVLNFYKKVDQGRALIVNTMKSEPLVTFTGAVVYPIIHRSEVMDISVKTIEIDRRGKEGLICKDNIRADIKVTFFVRVNKTKEDVLKVAQAIGCARASDQKTIEELFSAKFSEALKTVGKHIDFEGLYTQRNDFKDKIIEVIGRDLNGYVLEDAAIDYLEQTPLTSLDASNILDAQGIRKITELTAIEHVRTNEYENNEKKLIRKQDVEAQEAILELDRQKADAESKQAREIATVKAREKAEELRVAAEERLKAENARIKADEEIAINEENKTRQVEVARKNRERVIGVETERVQKDRDLEAISREREVELQRISKEKELEKERKEIQDVIRQRIAVEKTVAEEEERIKTLRLVEDAKRHKDASIIKAEGEAQEQLVKDIKAAEASEQASRHEAKKRLTIAEAELEAADRLAKAKMRLAEGVQAEAAATGLADVRVREAGAIATEKQGMAEARVTVEKMQATAVGEEAQGQARVRVREAEAAALEKVGLAEATVSREKALAEAVGTKEKLTAEAVGTKEKLAAEASGIASKAAAMKALDEAGRGHEEFRLRLDKEKAVELEHIHARREVAEAQARLIGEAFKSAKIDIVGGDGAFFDRMVNAISMGKSIDGFVGRSESLQTVLKPYLSGEGDLAADLKDVLSRPALGSGDIQNLTISAVIASLMGRADAQGKLKLQKLLETARSLGIDSLKS